MDEYMTYSLETAPDLHEGSLSIGDVVTLGTRAEPGGPIEKLQFNVVHQKDQERFTGVLRTDPRTEVRMFLRAGSQVTFTKEHVFGKGSQ